MRAGMVITIIAEAVPKLRFFEQPQLSRDRLYSV
jgi:hypothetical protein